MIAVRSSSERLDSATSCFGTRDFINGPRLTATLCISFLTGSIKPQKPASAATGAPARLPFLRDGTHRAAKAHVVAGRAERLETLIRSAGLPRAVAVGAASNHAARLADAFQSERSWVRPHVTHPLPNVAGHVLTSVRADTFREASASQ